MTYNYAAELLTPRSPPERTAVAPKAAPVAPTAPTDYASELLGPKTEDTFAKNLMARKAELEGSASFGGLTKAAMVDDQQTKIRILAADLFPGEKDAAERFGVLKGEIVYVGKDDKLYRAEPGIKGFAANVAGNALPIALGTAGAVAGAPAGPAGSIALGALGAAGGKGFQQSIASLAFDEPQSVGGNVWGMAKEAAFVGGGATGGALFQKWVRRNMARDINRFDPAKVADIDRKAAAQGVQLNVAQRTDVPSLKGRAEALARLPQSADDMNASLEATRQQAGAASDRFVEGVQDFYKSVRQGGQAGRAGAEAVLEKVAENRSTAARPLYEKAFANTVVDTRDESLQQLMGTDAFKRGYERALRIAKNEGLDLTDEKNAFKMLHYVKLGIDDLLDPKVAAREGIGSTEQRAILGVKHKLLQAMDAASPDYRRARSVYGHYMPSLKAEREGLLGALSEMSDDELQNASKMVFSPKTSAEEVRHLRSMFYRYDQGEKWKALTKGYLQDTLEAASKEFKSGPGAGRAVTWRYMLLGDPKQKANLRAALTDEQWAGFNDMMDVFEAVGRVRGTGNSITMPMQEAASELRKEAGSGVVATVLKPRQTLIDWLVEARLGKHAAKQVEILNDPNALARLKELKRLSPTDQRFIQGFSTLFGVTASPE